MWKILKRKTQKGDKTMENYYEVKGVSQATEIRKAYEEAVKANAPKYRAISKTNLIYGWDEKTNKFIKAEIGQEWFDNPHYQPIEEVIEDSIIETVEVKDEEVVVENTTEEIDYKALYEEKCKELEEIKGEKEELKKGFETLKNDLLFYKSKVTVFFKAFDELKNL